MRRAAFFLFLFASLTLLAGCPDDSGGEDTGSTDTGQAADVADTENADTADGGEADSAGTSDADASGADADGDDGGCTYQSDCADGEFCHDSTCKKARSCNGLSSWSFCANYFDNVENGLGRRAWCDGDHCRVGCVTDAHCADGEVCTDYGKCQPFDGDLSAPDPGGEARKPLEAGIGESLMSFPIGLSLGGYGSRMATNDGRYVSSLRATHGQMHGLFARAFILDNGERKLLFLRMPIIFPTSALHEEIARRLQEKTGKNWRNSLMISGTHTHSGPARFYQLPEESLLPLGRFGTDDYHDQAFEWLADSAFAAAEDALADMAPAKFEATIVEDFDGDDRISSDRWNQTPHFDDNRLLVMRIDDLNDKPRGVAISYGTHGTIHSDDYFTGDAISGVERGFAKALAEEYGRSIPVMYFNQNGGTMSPRGDQRSHDGPQRYEKLGHDFADKVLDDFKQMSPKRMVELAGTTYRFPITYDLVGYDKGEWGRPTLESTYQQYEYGGLQCSGAPDDSDPSTAVTPDSLRCIPIHQIVYNRPPTLFTRSQMSAFKLGDVTAVTAPGELSMELGWQILRELQTDHGIDPLQAWTFGYSQDHQFYLLPTNLRGDKPPFPGWQGPKAPKEYPDKAFSYLQGGYEPGMSFWGWKFGDFLVERASETVARLEGGDVERELPETLPTQFSDYGSDPFPIDDSDPNEVGTVVEQPPKSIARLEPLEFAWIGGDPGAEMPQAPRVLLERKSQGSFSAVETDRMRPYDNREPVMLTRLRTSDGQYEWVVRWEERHDFPKGTYRFKVEGHYQDSGERKPYELTSNEFRLKPSDGINVSTTVTSSKISGQLAYPAADKLSYSGTDEDPGRVQGNFRMRHPDVPTGVAPPVVASDAIQSNDIEAVVSDAMGMEVTRRTADSVQTSNTDRGGHQQVPTTTYAVDLSGLPAGTYSVEITATDAWGNTGTNTTTITISN